MEMNTDLTAAELNPTGDVFLTPDTNFPATTCQVTYTISNVGNGTFRGNLAIKNTSNDTIVGWTARFELAQGQIIQNSTGTVMTQSGPNDMNRTASNLFGNAVIRPGQTLTGMSFAATWDNQVNSKPPNITLNGHRCAVP
jgi:hypothetical protein